MQLSPGATIGIIGGGQLGRMLAIAAARLGLKTCILEPGANCPAAQTANHHLDFAYDDKKGLAQLVKLADVVTYEFENVPPEAATFLETRTILRPSSQALKISQDRLLEKNFLRQCGVDTARYVPVQTTEDLTRGLAEFSNRAILKTRRLGYDGKGQVRFGDNNSPKPQEAMDGLNGTPAILEALVDFEREISIIAARGADGEFASYDAAENTHEEGILRCSRVPAAISRDTAAKAEEIGRCVLEELDYCGVMGVEFFVTRDCRLLVNEIAPRVHNSGHWTEAACSISQFEQHIRAIAGWPLADPARHLDCVMENLIGDAVDGAHLATGPGLPMVHLYGKTEVRKGRKMGHVTRLFSPGHSAS